MKPVIAIVGRPNVGKSSLFNRLVGERKAIVLDTPGVTRDRMYADGDWVGQEFSVVDTGGFEPRADEGLLAAMREQALIAIEEADAVIFLMDGRDGLMDADREVAKILRRAAPDRVFHVVNKVDGPKQKDLVTDFYELGADRLFPVSAEHAIGVGDLLDAIFEVLPEYTPPEEEDERVTRIALIGRPNVGKSTLTNRLLGSDRMIVDSVPGTTRDAVDHVLQYGDKEYLLIDTAGVRRKRGIRKGTSEGFSVMRTMRAMDRCHVAVMMLDGVEGPTDQDARIAGLAAEKGRALVLCVNKWDIVEKDAKTAKRLVERIRLKLPFCQWAEVLFISGLTGQRVHKLMAFVERARQGHLLRVGTGELNRWLEMATRHHSPPVVRGRRLRLYYATQVRHGPPTVVVSCNDPQSVHFSYKRFLMNQLRENFGFEGTPIRLIFKGKKNPFVEEAE